MTFWAIVPVKPIRRGKSRLAKALSDEQRAELNKNLLVHTVDILKTLPELEQILVVSRDPEALALAREHGARTVRESGAPHLNVALERATVVATTYAAIGVLVLPADLPQITAEDIRTMIAAAQNAPVVVIAPDTKHEGTNALLINPAGLIEYDFGENSFDRHVAQAKAKGAQVKICELPSLANDVDFPDDLFLLEDNPEKWGLNGEKPKTLSKLETQKNIYESLD
ncbi:MAG: 2-phospho-L-lactate guanylyltransferase [Chloroflexota bacterium]